MIINKIICDRCGAEIEGGEHPPRILMQTYHISEKACVQNAYKNDRKIHFCESCQKAFEEFLNHER